MYDIKRIINEINKADGKPTAFIFDRVSTDDQQDGHSLQAQESYANRYTERMGFHVCNVFTVPETAYKTEERKHFRAMASMAQSLKIKHIVFKAIDRLSRNTKDIELIENLVKSGVSLHFYETGQKISNDSSADDWWTLELFILMAKRESLNTSTRVRHIYQYLADQGTPPAGPLPMGYVREKGKVIKDPVTQKQVETIFQLFKSEYTGITQFRKLLNSRGLFNRNGRPWTRSVIHHMLRNPFYAGKFNFKEQLITGNYEPYCTWEEYQERIKIISQKLQRPRGLNYRFAGMIRHEGTGRMMSGYMTNGAHNTGPYYYYIVNEPKWISIREQEIFDFFDNLIRSITVTDQYVAWIKDRLQDAIDQVWNSKESDQKRIQASINRLKKENKRLLDLAVQGFNTETIRAKIDENQSMVNDLARQQIKDDNEKYNIIGQIMDAVDHIKRLPEIYNESDIDGRAAIIREITDTMVSGESGLQVKFKRFFQPLIKSGIMTEVLTMSADSSISERFRTLARELLVA